MIVSRLLFESPWLLLVVLMAAQFGLITVWSWRRSRFSARAVWTGFAAIPTLLALSVLVVTPRERIIGLCRDLASMVDAGNVAGIARYLSEDFNADQMNRDAFLERIEQSLTVYHVDDARLRRFEVVFSRNKEAVAVFDAVCRVRSVDEFFDRLLSRWRLTFRGEGESLHVTRVEALPTPFSPVRDVRDWLR